MNHEKSKVRNTSQAIIPTYFWDFPRLKVQPDCRTPIVQTSALLFSLSFQINLININVLCLLQLKREVLTFFLHQKHKATAFMPCNVLINSKILKPSKLLTNYDWLLKESKYEIHEQLIYAPTVLLFSFRVLLCIAAIFPGYTVFFKDARQACTQSEIYLKCTVYIDLPIYFEDPASCKLCVVCLLLNFSEGGVY